jgi:hypothetical protein
MDLLGALDVLVRAAETGSFSAVARERQLQPGLSVATASGATHASCDGLHLGAGSAIPGRTGDSIGRGAQHIAAKRVEEPG